MARFAGAVTSDTESSEGVESGSTVSNASTISREEIVVASKTGLVVVASFALFLTFLALLTGKSVESHWARVDAGVVDGNTRAVVPTSTVVEESASGAGDTVVGGTKAFSTLEVTNFADIVLGVGTFCALLDTALTALGDLEVSFSGFTTGAARRMVGAGSAGIVAGFALEVNLVGNCA